MNFERGREPKEALKIGATIKARLHWNDTVYEIPFWLWRKIKRFNYLTNKISGMTKKYGLEAMQRPDAQEYWKKITALADEIKRDGQDYGYYKEWVRSKWIRVK